MNSPLNSKQTDKDPDFFVVGLQKSGTYWVTALLNAHPEITCLPWLYGGQTGVEEGRVFDMLASIDEDGGKAFRNSFLNHHNGYYVDLVPLLGKISKQELFEKFRDRYRQKLNEYRIKKYVGDKTTEYIFHLDMIDDFYPKAKKLCIIRDPRDRVVSWFFQQIRKGRLPVDSRVEDDFVRSYCLDRIKKEYESMIKYKGDIYCFTYEALSRKPMATIKGILLYLKAENGGGIIKTMIKEASIENLRKKDKLVKVNVDLKKGKEIRNSHYRKGIVGDWKNYLSARQAKEIDKILKPLEIKVFRKYNINLWDNE